MSEKKKTPEPKFPWRITVGFTDAQFKFLDKQVQEGKAESYAQLIRMVINEEMRP